MQNNHEALTKQVGFLEVQEKLKNESWTNSQVLTKQDKLQQQYPDVIKAMVINKRSESMEREMLEQPIKSLEVKSLLTPEGLKDTPLPGVQTVNDTVSDSFLAAATAAPKEGGMGLDPAWRPDWEDFIALSTRVDSLVSEVSTLLRFQSIDCRANKRLHAPEQVPMESPAKPKGVSAVSVGAGAHSEDLTADEDLRSTMA